MPTNYYELEDTLNFGKHKELTVEEIIIEHPSYFQWLLDETNHEFADEVHEFAARMKEAAKRGQSLR
jgi:hypothetical protein